MARIPYEERLRNGRLETFVSSPLWERFEGGRWRRYRRVLLVTKPSKDGLFRGGYVSGDTWHWTDPYPTEEAARRALFPLIETFADARDAEERDAIRRRVTAPGYQTDWVDDPPMTREELEDFAEPAWTKEELADFAEDPLTDGERQDLADFEAEMAEAVKDGDWTPLTPPLDFPLLPTDGEDPYDGY